MSKSAIQDLVDTVQSPAIMRAIVADLERLPESPKREQALALTRDALAHLEASPERMSCESLLQRIATGEIPDPLASGNHETYTALLDLAWQTRLCPRDGSPLSIRDNPRIPGLNLEIYCGCGFACTE